MLSWPFLSGPALPAIEQKAVACRDQGCLWTWREPYELRLVQRLATRASPKVAVAKVAVGGWMLRRLRVLVVVLPPSSDAARQRARLSASSQAPLPWLEPGRGERRHAMRGRGRIIWRVSCVPWLSADTGAYQAYFMHDHSPCQTRPALAMSGPVISSVPSAVLPGEQSSEHASSANCGNHWWPSYSRQ